MPYRIYVYALCHNMAWYVDRFMKIAGEADRVFVLDLSSTDGSAKKLRNRGAEVQTDKFLHMDICTNNARNKALALLPEDADICVYMEIESPFPAGWRKVVEAAWSQELDALKVRYTESCDLPYFLCGYYANEGGYLPLIHKRRNFCWLSGTSDLIACAEDVSIGSGASPLRCYTQKTLRSKNLSDELSVHHTLQYPAGETLLHRRNAAQALCRETENSCPSNKHLLFRVHFDLGINSLLLGEYADALSSLERCAKIVKRVKGQPYRLLLPPLCYAYAANGQTQHAVKLLYRLLGSSCASSELYFLYALLMAEQQDWFGTLFALQNVLEDSDIKNADSAFLQKRYCLQYLAAAYWGIGDLENSMQMYRQVNQLYPKQKAAKNAVHICQNLIAERPAFYMY